MGRYLGIVKAVAGWRARWARTPAARQGPSAVEAAAAPVTRTLLEAARDGTAVRLVYHGGSQPGTSRELRPLVVTNDEVLALDVATGIEKVFKVERIEISDHVTTAPPYVAGGVGTEDDGRTIAEWLEPSLKELRALGWHVNLDTDEVSVCRFFKNGRPRKGADVTLTYDEWTVDFFVELDGTERTVRRRSMRPYCLRSRTRDTRTYTKPSAAVAAFLDEAQRGPGASS